MKNTKTYGSAVLTALQASYKGVGDMDRLIRNCMYKAILNDRDADEWLDCFWYNIGILEAQRCQKTNV